MFRKDSIDRSRAECRREGHEWVVVASHFGQRPTGVICERCGVSYSIASKPESERGT